MQPRTLDTDASFADVVGMSRISFSEIDRLHRKERAKDRKRIASGKATPQQVQDENSLIPYGAKIKFTNFRSFLKEAYS